MIYALGLVLIGLLGQALIPLLLLLLTPVLLFIRFLKWVYKEKTNGSKCIK